MTGTIALLLTLPVLLLALAADGRCDSLRAGVHAVGPEVWWIAPTGHQAAAEKLAQQYLALHHRKLGREVIPLALRRSGLPTAHHPELTRGLLTRNLLVNPLEASCIAPAAWPEHGMICRQPYLTGQPFRLSIHVPIFVELANVAAPGRYPRPEVRNAFPWQTAIFVSHDWATP